MPKDIMILHQLTKKYDHMMLSCKDILFTPVGA